MLHAQSKADTLAGYIPQVIEKDKEMAKLITANVPLSVMNAYFVNNSGLVDVIDEDIKDATRRAPKKKTMPINSSSSSSSSSSSDSDNDDEK